MTVIFLCCLQWRSELEDILEVAQGDSELWVSMLAEAMRTLPSTGSLNLDIGQNEENRRIFSDLVNDLRKLGKYEQVIYKSSDKIYCLCIKWYVSCFFMLFQIYFCVSL